jgi:hypothetical protein
MVASGHILPQSAEDSPWHGRAVAPGHPPPRAGRSPRRWCGHGPGCSETPLVAVARGGAGGATTRLCGHLARMCFAVARRRKMHRPLLALRGKTVPCLVPGCPERKQTTAYPFEELRSSEHFHWLRTLRPDKHNRRTILLLANEKVGQICRTPRFGTGGTCWPRSGPGHGAIGAVASRPRRPRSHRRSSSYSYCTDGAPEARRANGDAGTWRQRGDKEQRRTLSALAVTDPAAC